MEVLHRSVMFSGSQSEGGRREDQEPGGNHSEEISFTWGVQPVRPALIQRKTFFTSFLCFALETYIICVSGGNGGLVVEGLENSTPQVGKERKHKLRRRLSQSLMKEAGPLPGVKRKKIKHEKLIKQNEPHYLLHPVLPEDILFSAPMK